MIYIRPKSNLQTSEWSDAALAALILSATTSTGAPGVAAGGLGGGWERTAGDAAKWVIVNKYILC